MPLRPDKIRRRPGKDATEAERAAWAAAAAAYGAAVTPVRAQATHLDAVGKAAARRLAELRDVDLTD